MSDDDDDKLNDEENLRRLRVGGFNIFVLVLRLLSNIKLVK